MRSGVKHKKGHSIPVIKSFMDLLKSLLEGFINYFLIRINDLSDFIVVSLLEEV